jgi:polysaccharide deacetylase 2 family uncharacterized protein YibQ
VAAADQRARKVGGRPKRGLIAAYLLVVALIAVSAAFVFGFDGGAPQIAEPAAAAAPAPAADPPQKVGSLAVPPRPPSGFRSLPAAELAELIEVTTDGFRLPRISPSGWMPWIAYARRFDPSGPPARIGILMINLGADEALTRRVIEELPGEVSLAFLPGAPDLPRWLREARARGHESYLMLPMEDPGSLAERGIRPIQASAEPAENLRRLRATMARGDGYVGLVIPSAGPVTQSEPIMRPLVKEIADRGLALIEINPTQASAALQRLTAELGVGYARTTNVLDYKLAGGGVGGNLDRLAAWVAGTAPAGPPHHGFGVMQPDGEAIDAIVAWARRRAEGPAVSFVPIIGHFECREACMARMRAQPAQLRP